MRRITVFENVSADGFFAAPDGSLDWAIPDEAMSAESASNLGETGTAIFGRKTYDMFAAFWPHAEGGGKEPHAGRPLSPPMRAMARWLNAAQKVVFSRTLTDPPWKPVRVVQDVAAIEALKRESGTGIMLFGSGSVVSLLTAAGLIDDYILVVNPVVLGQGRSLFADLKERTRLRLVDAKPFPSGPVRLRYTRGA